VDVEAKAKSSLTTEDTENTEEEEVVVTAVLCRSGSRNGFRWLSGEPYHTALEILSKLRPALRAPAPLWESFFPPGGAARLNLGSARRSDPTLVSGFRSPVSSPPPRPCVSARNPIFSHSRGFASFAGAFGPPRFPLHGRGLPWLQQIFSVALCLRESTVPISPIRGPQTPKKPHACHRTNPPNNSGRDAHPP
jgi:hypothetical protein